MEDDENFRMKKRDILPFHTEIETLPWIRHMVLMELENLPVLVDKLWSTDPNLQLEALTYFRMLLVMDYSLSVKEIINAGVIPLFLEFLRKHDQPYQQFETAWILTNIAAGTTIYTQILVEHGTIPLLANLLCSPHVNIREQAAWALGNIAGKCKAYQNLVLEDHALSWLLDIFSKDSKSSILKTASWALSNFFRDKPFVRREQRESAIQILLNLTHSNDEEVITYSCWALSYLAKQPTIIQSMIDADVFPRLVELLCSKITEVLRPTLHAVQNIIAGAYDYSQVLIDNQVSQSLFKILTDDKLEILKKEALGVISEIINGDRNKIQEIIDGGIMDYLLQTLRDEEQLEIKKLSASAISNAARGASHEQIHHLVTHGCIKSIYNLLTSSDKAIFSLCLDILNSILADGELQKEEEKSETNPYVEMIENELGMETLRNLQSHDDSDIHESAVRILELYWILDRDSDSRQKEEEKSETNQMMENELEMESLTNLQSHDDGDIHETSFRILELYWVLGRDFDRRQMKKSEEEIETYTVL